MIRDRAFWKPWEAEQVAAEPADFRRNLAIIEALYDEVRALGRWPEPNLEGLESRLKMARAIDAVRASHREPGAGA